ncbi:MAG TPA: hypothetical protein VNG32_00430 [Candidatus Dormibacteraeota bacterium]|nr:hypothetical protein [Candidatus Dormibacteraeota bacterium]
MKQFNIGFTYTATGHIDIEAKTLEEAEEKAQARLEEFQGMGTLNNPGSEEITWQGDEVEIW